MSKGKTELVNELEREWREANPRPHWTSDFWESCRPDFEEDASVQGD